jgi:hypothetical protein
MVAPDAFAVIDHLYPARLPPVAVKVWLPLGGTEARAGVTDKLAVTDT